MLFSFRRRRPTPAPDRDASRQIRDLANTLALGDVWCALNDHPEFLGGVIVSSEDARSIGVDPTAVDVDRVNERLCEISWSVLDGAVS